MSDKNDVIRIILYPESGVTAAKLELENALDLDPDDCAARVCRLFVQGLVGFTEQSHNSTTVRRSVLIRCAQELLEIANE